MSELSRERVEAALSEYVDPYLEKDLVSAKAIKNIAISEDTLTVTVNLGFPSEKYADTLRGALQEHLASIAGSTKINIEMQWKVASHAVQQGVDAFKNVRNIVAVASGKGGVGKSTVAVNLALALLTEGAKVGILDADIYGPSQPRMLGVHTQPESKDGRSLEPVVSHGIQSMSIGYLVDEETPMIWRGPMITQALEQLLKDTNWQDLDYLIVDLPPGTGDTQLTLAQKIPVSGAVIVTTPQDIALLDAKKGFKMFEKVNVPVLGIVENMSIHICSKCGHEEHIFGEGGGTRMSEEYGVNFLGGLPLDIAVRVDTDEGNPTVVKDPEGTTAKQFCEIARRMAAKLSLQAKDFSKAFPNIVISDS
uniref:Iron-sulfur cluster carrier protein n=1 Tax=Candidatus Kentrum sp. TUN TaxID=2126343 RepID=A0A450ZW84_9GAMM|nr:MAG: ATP-binding protein involved in chromosome partitioning [Candidatus Kentron sp. TUN]VFK60875.1 MAG: ATP-binding protein involved in chromosome partitioning [Candidatus Kentron sp. TUN]VFK67067.1 MAG: ATP-binding protein involved in chromosome partitioning [Candidatus Kentron sp. TUN]